MRAREDKSLLEATEANPPLPPPLRFLGFDTAVAAGFLRGICCSGSSIIRLRAAASLEQNQNRWVLIWVVLPGDLFCEATCSIWFTVIPPRLAEGILEICFQNPLGLNWYKNLVFSISELTSIDCKAFTTFLALVRQLCQASQHQICLLISYWSLWKIFLVCHGDNMFMLKWTIWLLLLLCRLVI